MTERGFKQMMAEANAVIDTISVVDAMKLIDDKTVSFIDVREKHEREAAHIPGSYHAARGFLELIAAKDGPMHQEVFASGNHLILYCGTGGRSALSAKTLLDMGIRNVSSMAGGFAAWKELNE
ncbi:MAG: rhodanese-like domain-containing protein [Alphaproteobacteria bacterium]|jgi:rhodanese-related sulfurtransferase|nr:rhodanese-like domain-containing protein [Alphaproteobacteria bacterium]MBT4019383.1 rhodanese-like domain-containing protein [Alphaproteobacteria bacterium]MBT5160672.1 rhodanese-like domain-containing protein [Alphaproteobacteria bacterium]MBT7744553.1 rhodanese-like domain-containing protein [Alphaproteobacteria bacterium]